jgi:hypothetical protein
VGRITDIAYNQSEITFISEYKRMWIWSLACICSDLHMHFSKAVVKYAYDHR